MAHKGVPWWYEALWWQFAGHGARLEAREPDRCVSRQLAWYLKALLYEPCALPLGRHLLAELATPPTHRRN